MKIFRGIGLLALFVLVVGAPLWLSGRTGVAPELMMPEKLVPLLASFLVSTAFVTALYTSFSNDKRLRSNSGKVLVALIWFAAAILVLAVALLLTAVGTQHRVAQAATYGGIII
jgi:type II secretory pathway component PulL